MWLILHGDKYNFLFPVIWVIMGDSLVEFIHKWSVSHTEIAANLPFYIFATFAVLGFVHISITLKLSFFFFYKSAILGREAVLLDMANRK